MRACWVLVAAVVGCMADAPRDANPPSECADDVALDGTRSATPTTIGPVGSTDVCLHLDARHNLRVGHFAASAASGFTLLLTDPAGNVLREGWDVGTSDHTFANLEFDIPAGQLRDAVLHVRAKAPNTAPTTVNVSLFEPLE
jgi:hypothetical protein